MLNVIILSVIILNVVMLSVIILSAIILKVIMPSVAVSLQEIEFIRSVLFLLLEQRDKKLQVVTKKRFKSFFSS